jgi:hypothetical protein
LSQGDLGEPVAGQSVQHFSEGLRNDLTFEVVRRQPDDYLMITTVDG